MLRANVRCTLMSCSGPSTSKDSAGERMRRGSRRMARGHLRLPFPNLRLPFSYPLVPRAHPLVTAWFYSRASFASFSTAWPCARRSLLILACARVILSCARAIAAWLRALDSKTCGHLVDDTQSSLRRRASSLQRRSSSFNDARHLSTARSHLPRVRRHGAAPGALVA